MKHTIVSQRIKPEIDSNLGHEILKGLGIPNDICVNELVLRCFSDSSELTLKCSLLSEEQEIIIRDVLKRKLGE